MNFDDQDTDSILAECCAAFDYSGPSVWDEPCGIDPEEEIEETEEEYPGDETDFRELNFDLD